MLVTRTRDASHNGQAVDSEWTRSIRVSSRLFPCKSVLSAPYSCLEVHGASNREWTIRRSCWKHCDASGVHLRRVADSLLPEFFTDSREQRVEKMCDVEADLGDVFHVGERRDGVAVLGAIRELLFGN